MTSEELVDLLYVAYNRDEAEVFSIDRAARAGYDELYTTAPDVLDKKMRIIDEEIEKKALALINEKVIQVRSKKQREIEEREANFDAIMRRRAETLLKQNESYIGKDTANQAIELIEEEANGKKTKEKGGDTDVGQAKKQTRGRKPKSATK